MKPKLKALVYYAPTSDGVVIRSWSDEFELKGKNMYDWMERLVPYLNGEQTVEQLTASLPETQKQAIEQLLQELVSRSVVVDAASDAEVTLSARELELYKQTLLFLECQCDEGRARFRAFRKSRVLLLGSGRVHVSLVRSLLRMGLRTPIFSHQADVDVRRMVDEWKAQDEDFQPLWSFGKNGVYAKPDLVVWASDGSSESETLPWMERCRREGLPLLVAGILADYGAVGPVMDADSKSSWLCLQHRWETEVAHPQMMQSTEERGTLLGNVAAMEVLKYVCQIPQSGAREHVVTVGPGKLEIQRRPLLPSPLRNGEQYNEQEAHALFRMRREETSREVFLAAVRSAVDARTGIVRSLRPLGQKSADPKFAPLKHVEAQMRLPGAGHAPRSFIGWGMTQEAAAEQAVRQALQVYAQAVSLQLRILGLEATHRADRGIAGSAVWASGRSYAEWRGRGLLACAAAAGQLAGEQPVQRMKAQRIPWTSASACMQLLQQRYVQPIDLTACKLRYGIGVEVAVSSAGELLSKAVGRCEEEALLDALQQAVSLQQRGLIPTLSREERPFPDQPEVAFIQEQPPLDDWNRDSGSKLMWTEWTANAEALLAEAGQKLIGRPWLGDAALYDWGLLVGRFYLSPDAE